jgi:hypothetical protein
MRQRVPRYTILHYFMPLKLYMRLGDQLLMHVHFRCLCDSCDCMPTTTECICCQEIQQTRAMAQEENVGCIVQHPGFEDVCLNIHVLRASYNAYRLHHGAMPEDQNRCQGDTRYLLLVLNRCPWHILHVNLG